MRKPRYRILVTGSRVWTDIETIEAALIAEVAAHPDAQLVVGDATGADAIAANVWWRLFAHRLGEPQVHKADWAALGRAAGPVRNHNMVNSGVDVCLAFPLGESRGTRDCMRRAQRAGVPIKQFKQKEQ